jgi:hypothetical protein
MAKEDSNGNDNGKGIWTLAFGISGQYEAENLNWWKKLRNID